MKKLFFLFFLLSACTGGLTGGEFSSSGNGPVAMIGGDDEGDAAPGTGGASGSDGVLGSQSSSSDIEVQFVRDYALDFEGETEINNVLIERPMVGSSQAFGNALLRKLSGTIKGLELHSASAIQIGPVAIGSQWVRAVNCGNFPDSKIESLIPPAEQDDPWAQDKLFWLVMHLPREGSSTDGVECFNPTYRDFPVAALNKVDLAALKGTPQDLFFFVRINSADFALSGALSTDIEKPLSDEQWLELSKKLKLRIVRLLPAGTPGRVHAIPAFHLIPN
ncbi:MAG TPA: hypothetical protein VJP40_07280 [bacterium]|nr:hypothetical protein [bacterium]